MTPKEIEAYDAMIVNRDQWKQHAWTATDRMEKAERELSAARKALESIEEIYIDGSNTYEDWLAMGKLARKFLSEK